MTPAVSSASAAPVRNRLRTFCSRIDPAAAFGVLFVVVVLVQVVVPPVLGLSDNGDFDRFTGPLGLQLPVWDERNGFVNLHMAYKQPGPNPYWTWLETPVRFLVWSTQKLGATSFDVRWLATFYAVLGGLGVWLLVRALPGRRLQVVTGALLVLVLGDSAFVAYLGSYYSEPSSLIGLLFVLAAVLALHGRRRVPVWQLVVFALAIASLVLAKAQNVALLLVLVPALLLLRPRKVGALLAMGLVVAGGAYLNRTPEDVHGYYVYDTIFVSILPHSPTPEADLAELGLDPSLIRYKGASVYHYSDFENPSFQRFWRDGGRQRIYGFYLRHPGRLGGLLLRGARDAAQLRPDYLGNRVQAEGYPRTDIACELCVYSTPSRWLEPVAGGLLPALYLLAFVVLWRVRQLARSYGVADPRGSPARTLFDGITVTLAMALLSFATAMAGEADFELVKHLFLFDVLTAVLVVLLLVAGLVLRSDRRPRRASSSDAHWRFTGAFGAAAVPRRRGARRVSAEPERTDREHVTDHEQAPEPVSSS